MNLQALNTFADSLENTAKMPVLFVGHGSPMNAIESNVFSLEWQRLGKLLPVPSAILCVSAHWETNGTYVTAMKKPPTIHDFGGFPQELFDVQYPAQGSPALALEASRLIAKSPVGLDEKWGLDHGAWSVLKHFYPDAQIPVIQLSLNYYQNARFHYELAQELAPLRHKGVLIMGSGNMVHNLRAVNWREPGEGYDWAEEANLLFKKLILDNNHEALIHYQQLGKEVALSVPSPEHYLPMLYALALKTPGEDVSIFNDKTIMGSLSMTSLKIG